MEEHAMNARRKPPSTTKTPTQNKIRPELGQAIRLRAYELFEQRGKEHGHDLDDWLQAEAELTARRKKRVNRITHLQEDGFLMKWETR